MNKDKPEVTKVMMLSLAYDKKERVPDGLINMYDNVFPIGPTYENVEHYDNFILPLSNFTVIEKEKCNQLILKDIPDGKLRKNYKRATLSLTDDPRVTWASDWSDLGCFRLVYKFFKVKTFIEKGKLVIESPRTEKESGRDRDVTIPDKVKWC